MIACYTLHGNATDYTVRKGFPGGASDQEPACQCRRHKRSRFEPCVRRFHCRGAWQTHSSILPWKIQWAEEIGRLQSKKSQGVRLDWNDLACTLEKEMASHSSVVAWRILWTAEPGGLLSMGSHRVEHDWSNLACMHALEKETATHSSILAWRIPGTEEPGGLPSMGSHRVGRDWSDLAAAAAGCMHTVRKPCFSVKTDWWIAWKVSEWINLSNVCYAESTVAGALFYFIKSAFLKNPWNKTI